MSTIAENGNGPSLTAAQSGSDRSVMQVLVDLAKIPAVQLGLAVLASLMVCFWPLISTLPGLWFDKDSYYSHGLLVPIIVGYVIYARRESLAAVPVKGFNAAFVPLGAFLYIAWVASRTSQASFLSMLFVACILLSIWFIAGGKWLVALSAPVLYLLFGLPIWASTIDAYTNPLQLISTRTSFAMLRLIGMNPIHVDSTTIQLNQFSLDVGIPCSGLKLILAISAFIAFFIMIAKLKPWANVLLFALVIPVCIFVNGLRIAMIGVVGNQFGESAGHQFHDYSGYLSILVCFVILGKITKGLGWNP